jgi:hypothetical protein
VRACSRRCACLPAGGFDGGRFAGRG